MTTTETLLLDTDKIRADFPILSMKIRGDVPLVYLDNAATTQRPRMVIDAMVETYEKHYANVHRGIHWLSDQSTDLFEEARKKVQQFIGAAKSEECIFTHGTTAGINLVARSWGDANVTQGDEILLTEMEHHSNLVPWQQLAQRSGAIIRHIPITDEGELLLENLDSLLTERTKIVAVAAISNVLGTINPISTIIEKAHQVGALVLIDAAQCVPHQPLDVKTLDADFVAFSGHKMLGPSGIGVLWSPAEILDSMPPFLGGGSMIRRVKIDSFTCADLPAKFEAGTPPIVPAIGLGAAVDYLNQIGIEKIAQHEKILTRHAHQLLEKLGGVNFLGPAPEKKSGIVSFTLQGVHAHDIAQLLDRSGVAIRAGHHCTMPLHKRLKINASARASFYFYNTLAEVDKFVEALEAAKNVFRRK